MGKVSRHARRIAGSVLLAGLCVFGVLGAEAQSASAEAARPAVVLTEQELAQLSGGQSRLICILQHAFEGCVEGAAVGGQIGGAAGAKAGCAAGAVIGAADGIFNRC